MHFKQRFENHPIYLFIYLPLFYQGVPLRTNSLLQQRPGRDSICTNPYHVKTQQVQYKDIRYREVYN